MAPTIVHRRHLISQELSKKIKQMPKSERKMPPNSRIHLPLQWHNGNRKRPDESTRTDTTLTFSFKSSQLAAPLTSTSTGSLVESAITVSAFVINLGNESDNSSFTGAFRRDRKLAAQ